MRPVGLCWLTAGLLAAPAAVAAGRAATPPVNFARDVQPILSKACFACHGPDEGTRAAGLRLDSRAAAVGGARPAVTPGNPAASRLLARVTEASEARRMPPAKAGPRLTGEQVRVLRAWIQQGAPYTEHWAFRRPQRPPVPAVRLKGWVRNPVDAFVLARLEKEGRRPAPEADRYTLLRRVSLDLRGLPPTPAEVDAFEQDRAPGAYERAVDRLLADPAYGERWARMWLDLARYADSAGYGSDPLRPNMWRYRDWVIDAFNRNLPYDQFTIEQLAGDLLPNPTLEQRMATAFHRNTMTNTEGGTDDEEWRVAAVKDRVDVTGQVWMGITVGCAKCHTHKYDPIQQKEYYSLFHLFNQTADNDQPDEAPVIPAPTAAHQAELAAWEGKLAAARGRLAGLAGDARKAVEAEVAALEKARPQPPTLPVLAELPPEKQRRTRVMIKGNFLDPGDPVTGGVPAAFGPLPPGAPANRLGVAQWIVRPDNPLTARVAVNRFWAQLFGAGLVETEEDFGTQGDLPSHPELLDWLATEYQRLGWDTKALLRLLVGSATYRQSARFTGADPRNRLLGRAPRHRLEAEMIRDQALALSGLLSRKIGGPSVFPPQPEGLWQAAFNGQRTWTTSTGEDRYRRGLYTFWRRTVPYPSMAAFDAPSREACTVRRPRTNTPLQAFVTLNDPVFVEAAQALGRRILREGGPTLESRVAYGLRLCLCRPARPEEVRTLAALVRSELAHFQQKPQEALALATEPLGKLPEGADAAEYAAWTVAGNVLLNLDGVLTRG
jgi:hypothetical protein